MLIIKLGGSLLDNEELLTLLTTAKENKLPIMFLTGGGLFAELVREQQKKRGFSDEAAHRMAIIAMQQLTEILRDRSGIDYFVSDNPRNTWPLLFPPHKLLTYDWNLPEDWSVTADSLSIRLAIEFEFKHCVLLKASESIDKDLTIDELSKLGVIDDYAPNLARQFSGNISVVSIHDFRFKDLLQS